MTPLNVILIMLLVRISVFAVFSRPDPVQKHHGMTQEARKRDHRSRSVPIFAYSEKRVFVFKRTAVLRTGC